MERLNYKGLWHCDAVCGLDIIQYAGCYVVILTELPDNTGTSVTNYIENLADLLCGTNHELKRTDTIWIEHYSAREEHEETFDLVSFKILHNGKFESPRWTRISREKVAELIGKEYTPKA